MDIGLLLDRYCLWLALADLGLDVWRAGLVSLVRLILLQGSASARRLCYLSIRELLLDA